MLLIHCMKKDGEQSEPRKKSIYIGINVDYWVGRKENARSGI